MRRIISTTAIILSLVFIVTQGVQASSINYGDFVGLNPGDPDFLMVKEDSITDPTPLYGPPTVTPNGLLFVPTSFSSSAANGSADTTSGTLMMRVRAAAGTFLNVLQLKETGDFSLLGVGDSATSATINGLVVAADINPGTHPMITSTIVATPGAPYFLPGDSAGLFTAVTVVDLTGLGIREIMLILNNNLQTTSQAGTTSFIQKKTIEILHSPEPSSLILLILGAGSVLVRGGHCRSRYSSN